MKLVNVWNAFLLQEMDVDGEDDDEIGIPKASKKKVVKTEDTKSKKEHVNVVFIGHVGKWKCATKYLWRFMCGNQKTSHTVHQKGQMS